MNTEDEEFNRIEREAKLRMEAVSAALDKMSQNERQLGIQMQPAQPSKPWVGLVWGDLPEDGHNHDFLRGATWAEAKLKEKNGG